MMRIDLTEKKNIGGDLEPEAPVARLIKKEVKFKAAASVAKIICLGEVEGMLAVHLAEMLNVSDANVRQLIKRNAIWAQSMPTPKMRSELGADVIPIRARSVLFVPKDSIKALIKKIDTSEAWDIYNQLWDDAEELRKTRADLVTSQLQTDDLRMQLQQKAHENEILNAKLEAASGYIISKAGKRRNLHVIVEYLYVGQDIWRKPAYQAFVTKKPLDDMSRTERCTYTLQHSARTYKGLSYRIAECLRDLKITNPSILKKSEQLVDSAHNLLEEIMPGQRRLQLVDESKP